MIWRKKLLVLTASAAGVTGAEGAGFAGAVGGVERVLMRLILAIAYRALNAGQAVRLRV